MQIRKRKCLFFHCICKRPMDTPQYHVVIYLFRLMRSNANHNQDRYIISQKDTRHKESIQSDKWKLIRSDRKDGSTDAELYNLSQDPQELYDISYERLEMTQTYTQILENTLRLYPIYLPIEYHFPDWIDAEHRRRLIETGYFF